MKGYEHLGDTKSYKLVLTSLDAAGVTGWDEHLWATVWALVWPATLVSSDTRQPAGFMTGRLCNVRASGQVTIAQTPIYGFIRSSLQCGKKKTRMKWQMSQGGSLWLYLNNNSSSSSSSSNNNNNNNNATITTSTITTTTYYHHHNHHHKQLRQYQKQ
ncbi:hypothetical protein E2C01_052908 [Portunus trituberculatus]|uniref:Uncharacterized protein n=1 Tax=Portunus trituberculatus TaxID=210409 RepID=A0A5B7GNQ0_PORTR|nr:hypothetical protein [Portunus trituberculatus]